MNDARQVRDLRDQPFYDVIKDYDNWVVLFRGRQVTIGSVIIMAKDMSLRSIGELSGEALTELGVVSRDVERWLREAFGAEKFNYLALMMKDPEVHFHVIPRYSTAVEFDGRVYRDVDWPLKTNLVDVDMEDAEKTAIYEKIVEVSNES